MHAVDTNVLVRLATRDDPEQVTLAEAFVTRGAWVSQLVLAETTRVLSAVYALDALKIAAAVEMILNHRELAVQEPEVVKALDHYRKRPSLGFSDCLILEVARRTGIFPWARSTAISASSMGPKG